MKQITVDQLRIIDANLNRIGEGLRVLEEFARLSLNDSSLTQQLKNMRHKMVNIDSELQIQLLQARDAEEDVGSNMEANGEDKNRNVPETIVANARRVQESLRVMEEIAKAPGLALDSDGYRKARFTLYSIEKELLSRMLRKDKIKRLAGLYVIIDTAWLKGRSHVEVASQAIRGGTKIIQLRCKERRIREFLSIAVDLRKLCAEHDVLFIVNDSLEVALAVGADGLHIGQEDLPVETARRLLPMDKILGSSVSTVDEARDARSDGADYLGVGAIYPTSTKEDAGAIGLAKLAEIRHVMDLPIVAIGGINKSNLKAVMKVGANAAAVISAVMEAADVEKTTRQMVNITEEEERG